MSDRPPTVIALDYPGPGQSKRIKTLGIEQSGANVRYLLDEIHPRRLDIIGYADDLAGQCPGEVTEIAVILAYCGAASIARQLAQHLRVRGASPLVCSINPRPPQENEGSVLIRGFFAAVNLPVSRIESLLSGDGDDPALTPASLARAEDELVRLYSEELQPDAGRAGARAMAVDLVHSQIDWACHIAAAGDPKGPTAAAAELHITSKDHHCPDTCAAAHRTVGADVDDLFQRLRPSMLSWADVLASLGCGG